MHPLKKAVEDRGGITTASALLAITPQRLSNWLERGVPIEHCARIEQTLGVPRKELRPDDWQRIWPELAQAT